MEYGTATSRDVQFNLDRESSVNEKWQERFWFGLIWGVGLAVAVMGFGWKDTLRGIIGIVAFVALFAWSANRMETNPLAKAVFIFLCFIFVGSLIAGQSSF